MEGTRSKKKQINMKDEEENSNTEAVKRKATPQDNLSPVAKRTRQKKVNAGSSSESGPEDNNTPKEDINMKEKEENQTQREESKKQKEENQKLYMELEAIKVELHKANEENQKNVNLKNELDRAHGKIENIMHDAHNKIVNLEKELCAAQEELDKMATYRAENTHRLAIQEELNEACVKVDQLKAENVGLCEELERLRKENHVAERAGLMKALTHACAELDRTRIQNADMQSEIEHLQSEAKLPARSPSNESVERVKALEDEIEASKEEIEKLKFENAQRNGLYTALTHSCAELDRVRQEKAKLQVQIDALKKGGSPSGEDDPLDLSSKPQPKSITPDVDIQDYEEEISRLRTEIVQLRAAPPMVVTVAPSPGSSDYPQTHVEMHKLQMEVETLKNYRIESSKLAGEIKELQKENQKMNGLQVALSHACTEVDKLRDEVTQEKTFSSAMCAQIKRQKLLEQKLAEANGQLQEFQREIYLKNSLENKLTEAYAEIDMLKATKSNTNQELKDEMVDSKKIET